MKTIALLFALALLAAGCSGGTTDDATKMFAEHGFKDCHVTRTQGAVFGAAQAICKYKTGDETCTSAISGFDNEDRIHVKETRCDKED